MNFIEELKKKAKQQKKRIVLPESMEERTLRAADLILEEGFADIILLGDSDKIKTEADHLQLKNIHKAEVVDPSDHPNKEKYRDLLYDLRKSKGLTIEDADKLVEDPLIYLC